MYSTSAASAQISRRSTFDALVVLAALVALLSGLVPGITLVRADAVDEGPLGPGEFQIDGDVAGDNDFDGFSELPGPEGEQDPDTISSPGQLDQNMFDGSQRETDYPGWVIAPGQVPGKSDLERLFVATQVAGQDSYVWLGASRVSDEGNTQVTAEFNQSGLAQADFGGAYRQDGDFRIRFNFPGNDTDEPGVDLDVWVGSPTDGDWVTPDINLPSRAKQGSIGGLESGDTRDFVEVEVNVAELFFPNGGDTVLECDSFGTVSFRTEPSSGAGGNSNPLLKDFAGPYELNLDTCGEVTVKKVDEEDAALSGAEFTVFEGEISAEEISAGNGVIADTTGDNPCTTGADGTCSFGALLPGTYTIDETVVPAGYRKAAVLPETFTVETNTPVDLGPYANPRIPYTIDVNPDGSNAVGNDHKFTVTLTSDDDDPLAGETVDLAWSGVGDGITAVDDASSDPGVTSTTCTTDGDGQCVVTVSSDDPGSGVLTASWDTPYQNTVGGDSSTTAVASEESATTPYATISDSGNKVWTGLRAEIEADGLNLLGDPHTFTVTVYEVDGEEPDVLADGVEATVSWDGPAGSTLDSTTCTTDLAGECEFVVDSDTSVGTGTLSVTALEGLVGDAEPLVVTFEVGAAGTPSADKTWREYRATIDDDSVNPAGQEHEFTVTVEYRDAPGDTWQQAPDGTTVAWDLTGDGTDDLDASTCDDGTTAGECAIVITSDAPGVGSVTLTSVGGSLLGDFGTTAETYAVADSATKTWLDFTVDVEADAINLVGEPHTFTVKVQESSDGADYNAVDTGSVVDFTLSDPAALVSTTCSDPGTDALGECTVTVDSDDTGTVTLTVTGITGYGGFDVAQDVTFTEPGSADKTWVDYRAFIAADGVNLVGDDHTFTVTAQVDDGTGWKAVADDTVVTVTSSGLADATVDQSDCADGTTNGTCDVVVDSDAPGTLTVSVETVGNLTAVDSDVKTVDVSGGENLEAEGQSTSADKTWIEYRADIDPNATNLTGEPHSFTVTAEQNDGSGWADVPNGTEIFYTVSDPAAEGAGSTCTTGTADGACTVEVESDDVAAVTVTVTGVEAVDVDGTPAATVTGVSAVKRWVEVLVDVEADATNIVGDDHTFDVDITLFTPQMTDGTVPSGEFTAVVSSSGTGTITGDTCATGTTTGACEVTVSSSDPGSLTVSVDSVSFSFGGTDFTVDFTDEVAYGEAAGQDLTGTKTWRDYRVGIEADGLNLVRDAHTFTVTVEQTDDGVTWADAPEGTTVSAAAGTPGSIDATVGTCDDGTVAGECTIVVNATTAGTSTATVTAISVDDPATPGTVDPVSFDVTDDSADKTWAAFRATTSGDAVNITGDEHDFTISAEYTVDGSTWVPVPDGSVVSFSSSGVGTDVSDTCDSTVGGDCTATVDSEVSGQRSITVTGLDATITVGESPNDLTESFQVTFEDGASGVLDGFDAADYTATKTWAAYALALTPLDATNLLNGQDDDTERFHTITATLTSDDETNAPTGGQDVDVSISGDTGVINSVEAGTVAGDGLTATCTTDASGACDIVIFSATPGTATLAASYEAVVGESDPFTVEAVDATKTWTTYRVSVTPEQATNLVGNAHTFTVTVEQSTTDGTWDAVDAVVPTIDVTGTDLTVDASDCDAGTDAAGQCEVVVNSETVQAVTLTATYDASVGQVTAAFSDSGDKDWIDYAVDVDPAEAENLVDTDHVFTVTVTTTFPGAEGPITEPVVAGVPTIELSGPGSIVDTDCDSGTDEAGQCTVTTTSPVAGPTTLTATFAGTAGEGESRDYVDSGDKLWVDYLLTVDPDEAVNATGDAHTFTATLLVDTGEGFGPAAGETVDVVLGGDTGDLVSTTCDSTDEIGQCEIVINSSEPGTTSVTASYGAVVGETTRTFSDTGIKQWAEIDLVKSAILVDGEPLVDDEFGDKVLTYDGTAVEDIADQTVTYEYVITNTSPVTIENVRLEDDRLGILLDGSEGITLAPGESHTVTADETFSAGDAEALGIVTNVADVIGDATLTSPDSELTEVAEVTDTDDETVLLELVLSEVLAPSIDLVKTALIEPDADGTKVVTYDGNDDDEETITYEYVITNTGETELVDITLVDDVLGTILDASKGVSLAPGESTTVEAIHLVTEADANAGVVVNVAVTTGTPPDGGDVTATDDETVEVQEVLDVPPLVRTGLDSGALGASGILLMTIGLGALWADRRRRRDGGIGLA